MIKRILFSLMAMVIVSTQLYTTIFASNPKIDLEKDEKIRKQHTNTFGVTGKFDLEKSKNIRRELSGLRIEDQEELMQLINRAVDQYDAALKNENIKVSKLSNELKDLNLVTNGEVRNIISKEPALQGLPSFLHGLKRDQIMQYRETARYYRGMIFANFHEELYKNKEAMKERARAHWWFKKYVKTLSLKDKVVLSDLIDNARKQYQAASGNQKAKIGALGTEQKRLNEQAIAQVQDAIQANPLLKGIEAAQHDLNEAQLKNFSEQAYLYASLVRDSVQFEYEKELRKKIRVIERTIGAALAELNVELAHGLALATENEEMTIENANQALEATENFITWLKSDNLFNSLNWEGIKDLGRKIISLYELCKSNLRTYEKAADYVYAKGTLVTIHRDLHRNIKKLFTDAQTIIVNIMNVNRMYLLEIIEQDIN